MNPNCKLCKLLRTSRDPQEAQDWLFSLTPLGVAFVFFFFLIMPLDLPNKTEIMVLGGAAGLAGLQAYWVYRGWCKNNLCTVLLGVIALSIIGSVVWVYLSLG
jgi:pheromone shutdown protein TraB